jgi:HEAT repeat protein
MMPRWAEFILAVFLASLALSAQEPSAQSPKERARAVKALARQGADAIPKLTPFLSDPDLDVRVETVKAIVDIDTQYSLDPLIRAAKDNDPEIQIRATDGLVNFYLPGYVRTGLASSLRRAGGRVTSRFTETNDQVIDPFVQVRPEIIEALGRLCRGGASMESRANAARAIGILRGRAAIPDLLEAAHSKDSRLIYECVIAFQKIRDASAGPQISFLIRDLDEKVQVAAAEAAGLLFNKEALPDLRGVLERTENKRVRRAALTSIAMLPDPANRNLLLPYLRDKDAGLRAAAAEGLGRLKDPADLPALQESFNEERDNSARVSIAFALVMHGRLELSEFSPLQYLVNTLNSAVRAGQSRPLLIEAARDADVRRALYPALRQGTKSERIGLALVMGWSGDRDSVPHLEPLTRDPDVQVASEAMRALRTLNARLQ